MIICVCGKSASGKTTLCQDIQKIQPNSVHIDVDNISHQVLEIKEVQESLANTFGKEVVVNHKVNRQKLGNIVFNSQQQMERLTLITWKYMEQIIDNYIKKYSDKLIIFDWLLLPKTKYFEQSNYKILLEIPFEERLKRALKRDNISEEAFRLREKASLTYDKEGFDLVINSLENKKNFRKLMRL